jgi:hypothetical protein
MSIASRNRRTTLSRRRALRRPALESLESRRLLAGDALQIVQSFPIEHVVEGQTFERILFVFKDTAGADPADNYSATIAWGDGTTSAGTITAFPSEPGLFVVGGRHEYADEASHQVTVGLADKDGGKGSGATTAKVDDAPLFALGLPVHAVEGQSFHGAVAGFFDPSPEGADSYKATIDWGDGTHSDGTIVPIKGEDGHVNHFLVVGTHTNGEEGHAKVTVAISDEGGSKVSAQGAAEITDAPLHAQGAPIQGVEGQQFHGVVATFTDPAPEKAESYKATIHWGDGATSDGTVVAVNGQDGHLDHFAVVGTHAFGEEGRVPVSVLIQDEGGARAEADSTAAIEDAALHAQGTSVSAVEGQEFRGVVATFTDAKPEEPGSYKVTIEWGDGTHSDGVVVPVNGQDGHFDHFAVMGTHTYADEGHFQIAVQVQDEGGAKASALSTATVADAPLHAEGATIHPVQGQEFHGIVATFTDPKPEDPASYRVTIDWGDGFTSDGTVVAVNGQDGHLDHFAVMGTHTYTRMGQFPLTVHIVDEGGADVTAHGTADVGTPAA